LDGTCLNHFSSQKSNFPQFCRGERWAANIPSTASEWTTTAWRPSVSCRELGRWSCVCVLITRA
jgi:hypothetical protein